MKKLLLTLAAIAACGMASASTVLWTVEAKAFGTSDGSAERAENYFVTVFLYSDYADVMDAVATLGTAPESSIETINGLAQSTGKTAKTGKAAGSFTSSEPSITTVQLFSIAWDAASIADATHYNLSSQVSSDAYSAPDNPTNVGSFGSSSYSGGWKTIPEPSVALMGLLGLGMLLKRRRA